MDPKTEEKKENKPEAEGKEGKEGEAVESTDTKKYATLSENAADEPEINFTSKNVTITQTDLAYLKSKKKWTEIAPQIVAEKLIQQGFTEPSRIQSLSVPISTKFKNLLLIAQSQNGTGKTLGFLIPVLLGINASESLTTQGKSIFHPQALVLLHAKELCIQTYNIAKKLLDAFPGVKVSMHFARDTRQNLEPGHLVIATPGSALGALTGMKKQFDTTKLKILAVDEADYLLQNETGKKAVETIAKAMTVKEQQYFFFSATYTETSINTINSQQKPGQERMELLLPAEKLTLAGLYQFYKICPDKLKFIDSLLSDLAVSTQSIIFLNTKRFAVELLEYLRNKDHSVALLMGGGDASGQGLEMGIDEREKTFAAFKNGDIKNLITTNLMARGIDNRNIGLVINCDVPTEYGSHPVRPDIEMYLHRIGRTGRFADVGLALNLLTDERQMDLIHAISAHYKCDINKLEGMDQLNDLLKKVQDINESKRKENAEQITNP